MTNLADILRRQRVLERVVGAVSFRSSPSLPDCIDPERTGWDPIPSPAPWLPNLLAVPDANGDGVWFVGVTRNPHHLFVVGIASPRKLADARRDVG